MPKDTTKATEAAAKARRKQTVEKIKEFRKQSEAYFQSCDEEDVLYSEPGLADFLGCEVNLLHYRYDYNDGRDPEEVAAAVADFEVGKEVDQPQQVMSHYVRMAYMRIWKQVDTDPRYMEKSMVSYKIFLNKQKRLGGRQDRQEMNQNVSVNVVFGKGADEKCWE